MAKINGVSVTQFNNLNVKGNLYVAGSLLGTPGSSGFDEPNVTNISGSLNITNQLSIEGVVKNPAVTNAITAFADAGGGEVAATSANHNLVVGDPVTIADTTNYDGTFTVNAVPDADTFEFTDTFVATETGTWTSPTPTDFQGTVLTNVNVLNELGVNEIVTTI